MVIFGDFRFINFKFNELYFSNRSVALRKCQILVSDSLKTIQRLSFGHRQLESPSYIKLQILCYTGQAFKVLKTLRYIINFLRQLSATNMCLGTHGSQDITQNKKDIWDSKKDLTLKLRHIKFDGWILIFRRPHMMRNNLIHPRPLSNSAVTPFPRADMPFDSTRNLIYKVKTSPSTLAQTIKQESHLS